MMNLPPVIWTISVAFVPAWFRLAVSFGGVAGALGISFEALRSHPGSSATTHNRTDPARNTGERVCLARCVGRLAEHAVRPHAFASSWQTAAPRSVGETPADAAETVALPILKAILTSQ